MTKQRAAAVATSDSRTAERRERRANQDEVPMAPSRRLPERLMTEMRVDVGAHATHQATREDNQQVADDFANVSLELLALLSPHGTTQQWEEDEDEDSSYVEMRGDEAEHNLKRLSMLARVDLTDYPGHSKSPHRLPPDLTSPTQHMEPFQVSPTHSAHGNELDLASPVALPDSPQSQELPWSSEPLIFDSQELSGAQEVLNNPVVIADDAPELVAPRPSPSAHSRRDLTLTSRRSPQPPHVTLRTPGKTSLGGTGESKPKARHGGIYSLLLKNKPPEHEPVLVDDKRSPLGPEASPSRHSVTKRSSPPSFAKLQHGGIYGLLRHNSKDSD